MNVSAPKSTWMITLLLAGVALAYTYFLFLPNQRKITELRDKRRTIQQYVVQSAETAAAIERTRQQIAETSEFVTQWEANSPREEQLAKVYGSLSERCRLAGASLLQLEPEPPRKLDVVWQAPVGMTLEGDFSELFDLLRRIEALPQTIWMPELEFTPARQGGEALHCELMLAVFAANREKSD